MNNYFVTGIDTDSGKTLISAILCEALNADYWKPIQAGFPRDADTVMSLISNSKTIAYPERYLLQTPASPHAAANIENILIALNDFVLPKTEKGLIVEGAGGVLVPINDTNFMIDVIKHLGIPAILVADLYLGSINHTLLSIEALRNRNIRVAGIIFNGSSNPESERIILRHSQLSCLLRVEKENKVDSNIVQHYAAILKDKLQ
jgi:dethiobiotin synthetase